jgi:dienelactone hydrolase
MGLLGRAAAVAGAALLAAGCGGAGKRAHPAPRAGTPFAYLSSRPLDVRDAGRANGAYPIAVRNVSYSVPGGRVDAYLAVPPHRGRVPAVIYLHGSGGDRLQLLVAAVWMAARRAVGMTITLPSTAAGDAPSGLTPSQSLARERRLFVADVVAVRRAVDLLRARSDVDPGRVGLVGWSYGAKVAAVLAGVEPRIRDFVLISAGATPVSAYVARAPASLRPEVRRVLTAIDPLRWIARARPGTILLQDGRKDTVVPRAALLALARAAPRGTALRWYAAGHGLTNAAYREQLDWLARKLAVRGPAVAGAKTGP